MSTLLHVVAVVVGLVMFDPEERARTELVDIEVAPPPPLAEALPAEIARPDEDPAPAPEDVPEPAPESLAAQEPPRDEDMGALAVDAGVPDAPIDIPVDAMVDIPVDAMVDIPVDAPLADAAAPLVASADAGVTDAPAVAALADAGVPDAGADGTGALASAMDAGPHDATVVAAATDAGPQDAAAVAAAGEGSGAGEPAGSAAPPDAGVGTGLTTEPAVAGAPTSAGTAANLLTYFPSGHVVTALIRFDRLRGTEWAAPTERLLRPMPDYRVLFGATEAKLGDRLDTLVISTPRPRDATATTLVAHTRLGRAALRDYLGAGTKVTWSAARGGLLGRRGGALPPGDERVFLSPFRGWFLLAQPRDLGALTAPVKGDLDTIEARGKLPAWLGNIRAIEAESGDPRGPALVVTLAAGGERVTLDDDFGLGVKTFPTPARASLAMELVQQGWLVRGNLRFASADDAAEFLRAAETVQQGVARSRVFQLVLGKPFVRVVGNLSFAQTDGRVSYATSVSIADARAILSVVAQQLDRYFATTR